MSYVPDIMETELDYSGSGSSILQSILETCDETVSTSVVTTPPSPGGSSVNINPTNPKAVNDDRPWECEKCGFRFKYKNNMMEHMRFYHMKGSVPCNICSEVFATSTHLRLHRKDHALQQGRCPHCRCTLPGGSSNPELYHELYNKHLPHCRRCPAKISSRVDKSSQHSAGNKSYTWCCLVCCQKFLDLTDYENHDCHSNKLTDVSIDRQELANLLSQDTDSQRFKYQEANFPYELPVSNCNSSDIDYNFLCIICGVNFENEDQLNLHFYESHQTCDHDTLKNNLKSPSSEAENEVSFVTLVCHYCRKDFTNKCALIRHEETCKYEIDNVKKVLPNTSQVVKEITENTIELIKRLEKSDSDLAVPSAHKDDEEVLIEPSTLQVNEDSSTLITEVPISSSSAVKPSLSCTVCNALFPNAEELDLHKQECKEPNDANTPEVIVQWLCKYCKVAYDCKSEMRAHKQVCALKNKTSEPKNVLIMWVCKYCKNNFETRESMCTHKKTCLLRSKDKSVISSTESDISEIACKEALASKRKNSFCVDEDDRASMTPKYEIGKHASKRFHLLQDESQPESNDLQLNNDGVFDYKTSTSESLGKHQLVKNVDILFPFSAQDESVLVKWVCKYCKEDFEDRESMCCHKKACKQRQKDKNIFYSSESDYTNKLINGNSDMEVDMNVVTRRVIGGAKSKPSKGKKAINMNTEVKTKKKSAMTLHTCEICVKKFAGRAAMKAHNLECHMFKCFRCGRYFGNNSQLWKHARICRVQKTSPSQRNKMVFTCKRCYRVFRERYKYNLHKLSCLHEVIKNRDWKEKLRMSVPGEKAVLRIQCSKCTGSYIGNEIFSLHTCDDPTSLEIFMDCNCGLRGFPDIPSFYSHYLCCSISNLEEIKNKPSSPKTPLILCSPCGTEFSDVFLYYLHLHGHPLCRVSNGEVNIVDVSECQSEETSVSQPDVLQSEDECNDWTCSFCKFIIPSYIQRNRHYQMCKTKVCYKCGFFSLKHKGMLKHNCSEGLKYMTSARVVLERFPHDSVLEDLRRRQLEVESPEPVPARKQVRVQRCVMCYKKCKLEGVGLPPIGQLECFQCRNKMHRKELKKRRETFFSRSLFDTEESESVSELQEPTTHSVMYLDPSKRLKMSRSLLKWKPSSPEVLIEQPPARNEQQITTSAVPSAYKILQKCSHCKRAFSSKGQLDKHVKLSKTCMHAEATKENGTKTDIRGSPIINFVDFLTSGSRALSFRHSEFTTSSEEIESVSFCSNTQNNTSCSSSILNDTASNSNHGSSSNYDEMESSSSMLSGILSDTIGYKPNQANSRPSYLFLERIEKVLSSHKQVKRVPISSVLQCDGWILRSDQHVGVDGSAKSKYICGACFKSFSTQSEFSEHALTVHQLSPNSGIKLNVMKHIPNEALNKLSW